MKKFYLYDGTEQKGPFSIDDLKEIDVKATSFIWYEGLPGWQIAKNIDELKELFSIPNLSPINVIQPAFQKEKSRKRLSITNLNQKSVIGTVAIFLGIIMFSLAATFIYKKTEIQDGLADESQARKIQEVAWKTEENIKKTIRKNITSYVTVERSGYVYYELGGIYHLKISVSNKTDYILDIVKVKVKYIKANGGLWKEEMLDFNSINPQTKVTLKAPDSRRGTSVDHEIVSIKSHALGIY